MSIVKKNISLESDLIDSMKSDAKKIDKRMSFSSYIRYLHENRPGENRYGLSPADFIRLQEAAQKEDRTVVDQAGHAIRVFLNRVLYAKHFT